MIHFNRDELRDKISACWLGKNIGGTLGTPYEGKTGLNDIQGFATKPGKPLPNDDLDLQLIWLKAMREVGPKALNAKILGEYWIDYITPFWNEYGNGKANMMAGLLPPMSGQYRNGWKDSNGAWIRTEIWACLYPGLVEEAIRFAFEDACVDHGFGEGSYAAIFIAAIESAAFVIQDLRTLIRIGLSKIPPDCRVARSVNIVLDAFDRGLDWKGAHKLVTDDSLADLGYFQAPANVAYVILGLLYGGGDFKKTLILAVNCADDTDCTAATAGSILGLTHGMKAIPADWQAHIGDEIITISISRGQTWVPKTCAELTDEVMDTLPLTLFKSKVKLTDGEADLSGVQPGDYEGASFCERMFSRSPWSFEMDLVYATALVELDGPPEIAPGGSIGVKITLRGKTGMQKHVGLRWILPEGWRAEGGSLHFPLLTAPGKGPCASESFTVFADGNVAAKNRLILELACQGRPHVGLVPILLFG